MITTVDTHITQSIDSLKQVQSSFCVKSGISDHQQKHYDQGTLYAHKQIKPTTNMTEISQIAKEFWQDYYNVDTNWYALYIPLCVWAGFWLYARIMKIDFFGWTSIHIFHHLGAIVIASLSLYYDDDSIINERVGILWSIGYFIVDTMEAILKRHLTYILHGAIALSLGLGNYNIPLLRSLRMNSKASYIETSSLILPSVKKYRQPWLFGIFALVYTMCRIIWIPRMIKDLLDNGMKPSHPSVIGVSIFYCLNIHWYIKIIKILIYGPGKKKGDNDEDPESKNKNE